MPLSKDHPHKRDSDLGALYLSDVQGNIILGFNKDHQALLHLEFDHRRSLVNFLKAIVPLVTSTEQVFLYRQYMRAIRSAGADPNDLVSSIWTQLSFTADGLRLLGVPEASIRGAFAVGMGARSQILGDEATGEFAGSVKNWVLGHETNKPHLALLVSADSILQLEDFIHERIQHSPGMRVLHHDRTQTNPKRGREPFGFKDGISQPNITARDNEVVLSRRGGHAVHLGKRDLPQCHYNEILFRAGPRCAPSSDLQYWMNDGSFLVFRRYEQDSELQKKVEFDVAEFLNSISSDGPVFSPEEIGARLIGRWRDGTPIHMSPKGPNSLLSNENNFDFTTDPKGPGQILSDVHCPYSSHLRKCRVPQQSTSESGEAICRQIVRRGFVYSDEAKPENPRGLCFIAYMNSIEDKFEYIMSNWVNNEAYPKAGGGIDPLIGRTDTETRNFNLRLNFDGRDRLFTINIPRHMCYVTGGDYFFAPSIPTLKSFLEP